MANTGNIVKLNVGGVLYTTTKTTLCNYPESMLGAMFNGTMESTKDEHGCYFIDRDGKLFEFILNFLRSSELVVPKDLTTLTQLRLEASFYQISPLVEVIGDMLDDMLIPKTLEYFVIEHKCVQGHISHTILGKADLIKKYFQNEIPPGKQLNGTYETLILNDQSAYHPMTYGGVLLQDGWKLSGSTTTVTVHDYNSTAISRDTWCLEK